MKNSTRQKEQIPFPSQDLVVRSPAEVGGYLERHPGLARILPAISKAARKEFGKLAELSLGVYHDPEIDDHYLTLVVRLPSYDRQTMKRIDAVWEKFENDLAKTPGWLTLTTDFRRLKGINDF